MKTLISHEVPLCLLEDSKTFNDYDYCLPHLLDKYFDYRNYFMEARHNGRFIIMDNGLFEGVTHTEEDLLYKINLIKPDIFIVPDEWNNPHATYRNAKHWVNNIKPMLPETTNLMVVMQGKNTTEIHNLYNTCIDLGFKHFAFNHSSICYQTIFNHPNKLVNQMLGRVSLISEMIKNKTIHDNHYIHLLGASLPQEFIFYQWSEFQMIKSVDTSSPIVNGALGITYNEYGLFSKPECKIEEFFEDNLDGQKEDILFNINKFAEYVR